MDKEDASEHRRVNPFTVRRWTRRIRKIPPEPPRRRSCRGECVPGERNYGKAIRAFTRSLKLDPHQVAAYRRRAEAYYEKGDKGDGNKALADFSKVVALEPWNSDGYVRRGVVRREYGDHDKAVQDLTRAIHLNPQSAAAYAERGRAYTAKEAFDLAFADCNKALRLDAHSAEAFLARGQAYFLKDENDLAISDFNEGIGTPR